MVSRSMDADRTALRLGAEKVYIVYRRSLEELPARKEEVEHTVEEGIDFRLLCNPVEILGYENTADPKDPKNGFVRKIRCMRMELGEPDASSRRWPVPMPNSEFELDVDTVVVSNGDLCDGGQERPRQRSSTGCCQGNEYRLSAFNTFL